MQALSERRVETRSGFTLAEVLFALAIAGLVAAAVHELLAASYRQSDLLQRSQTRRGVLATLSAILERDLAGFYPLPGAEEPLALSISPGLVPGWMAFSFPTTADSFMAAGDQEPAVRQVTYRVRPSEKGSGYLALFRGETPYPEEGAEPARGVWLTQDLRLFEVEVFDGEQWRSEWPPQGERKQPEALRIRLRIGGAGGEPVWVVRLLDCEGKGKQPLLRLSTRRGQPPEGVRQ